MYSEQWGNEYMHFGALLSKGQVQNFKKISPSNCKVLYAVYWYCKALSQFLPPVKVTCLVGVSLSIWY